MKVLFTYDYGTENINKVKDLGYEVTIINERDIKNSSDVNNTEILICYNPFELLDINKIKNLKYILLSSIGFDQLPMDKVKNNNIVVTNNRGGYSIPMGEHIVLSMLEIYRNSKAKFVLQNENKWKIDTSILEVFNKNILFIGTGTIATEAIKRLSGFDMNIYGINTTGKETENIKKCYKFGEMDRVIKNMDFVVLSLPHTDKTHYMVDYEFMNKMKDDSVLINVSRGKIINEKDLILQLKEGKFKGVALDVFETEPLDNSSELWGFQNVNISSHSSWISEMRNIRRFDYIYKNLKRLKENEALINVVNLERGY